MSEELEEEEVSEGSPQKKRKVEPSEDVPQKYLVYRAKAISVLNEYWAMTSLDSSKDSNLESNKGSSEDSSLEMRVDASHIKITFDEKKKIYVIRAACLICKEMVTLSKTEYSVSAGNYKSHIVRKHVDAVKDDAKGDKKQITLKDLIAKKHQKNGTAQAEKGELSGVVVDLVGGSASIENPNATESLIQNSSGNN